MLNSAKMVESALIIMACDMHKMNVPTYMMAKAIMSLRDTNLFPISLFRRFVIFVDDYTTALFQSVFRVVAHG